MVRDIFTISSFRLAGQVAVFLTLPLISALAGVEAIGVYGIFVAILAVAGTVSCCMFDQALPIARDEEIPDVVALCLLSALVVAGVVVVLAVFDHAVTQWLDRRVDATVIAAIAAGVIAMSVQRIAGALAVRQKRFFADSLIEFFRLSVMVVLQLLFLSIWSEGIVLGHVVGAVIAALVWIKFFVPVRATLKVLACTNGLVTVMKRYSGFARYSLPSSLINAFTTQLPVLAFGSLYGAQAAGLIFLADRLVGIPSRLLSQAIGRVVHQRLAERTRGDRPLSAADIAPVAGLLVAMAAASVIAIYVLGDWGVRTFFADEFHAAIPLLNLLVWLMAVRFVVSPFASVFMVEEKQKLLMIWEVLRLVAVVLVFVLAAVRSWNITDTLYIFVVFNVISFFILISFITFIAFNIGKTVDVE